MATVKCAVCNKEILPRDAKRCNNCEIWLCKNCVKSTWTGVVKCPKCGKEVK
jgi:hypothetical protein